MKQNFRTLSKAALLLVYLVIFAGAIVRMTGSGMGCPDWPKCFGYYIPPTEGKQLLFKPNHSYKKGMMIILDNQQFMVAKNDFKSGTIYQASNWEVYSVHDYVVYDSIHTWIEFINRLIGTFAGLPILILGIWSFWFLKENPWITFLALLTVFGMGFQAWLGKTVVDSNLAPYKITVHMAMALLIVFFLLTLIFKTKTTYKLQVFHSLFFRVTGFSILLTLLQIALGTEVRQFVDEQTKLLGYEKGLWLSQPEVSFYIHRSTSILVLLTNAYLWFNNKKYNLGFKKINLVMGCILFEIFTGILMYYFQFPFLTQPVHLILASLLFGIQLYIYLEIRHQKKIIGLSKTP